MFQSSEITSKSLYLSKAEQYFILRGYTEVAVIGLNNVNCVKDLKNLFMLGNIGLNLVHKHFGQLACSQT